MKKFLKNKQSYYILAAAVIIILAVILYSVGFRITYAPELENSWDAISAVAAWASVIASFIAIWFAIRVPSLIAKRQDAIALFEKKIECYIAIQRLLAFATSIKEENTVDGICRKFFITMGYPIQNFQNSDLLDLICHFQKLVMRIITGQYLYKIFYTEDLQTLINGIIDLVIPFLKIADLEKANMELSSQDMVSRDNIYSLAIEFESQHLKELEQELTLR